MQLELFWLVVVFVFGTTVGSFLNVVTDRLPHNRGIIRGRSRCDHCQRTLKWFELIPLLSFIVLGGRCRTCKKKLSWQYPVVELLTGIVLVLLVRERFPSSTGNVPELPELQLVEVVSLVIFLSSLITIAIIDLKHGIIPDEILVFLLIVWGLGIGWGLGGIGGIEGIGIKTATAAVPAMAAGLFFYLLVAVTKGRGMGGGDVKLAFVIGLFLSPLQTFVAIYLAFLLGGLVALALLGMRRKKFGQTIPFGPFLAVGTLISVVWGEWLMDLYLTGLNGV